jgi:hypothetical protein
MSTTTAVDSERGSRVSARGVLLHPVALVAAGILVINDHLLKVSNPSWLTGKLSDVAGLVVAPLLLSILLGTLTGSSETRLRPKWPIVLAVLATAFGFAAVKLWPAAADVYRVALGYSQWPFGAVASLPDLPPVRPVLLVADSSDLIALPAIAVPLLIVLRRRRSTSSLRRQRLAGIVLVAFSVALLGTSPAVPSVSDTQTIEPVRLSVEDPAVAWEITLTASGVSLPTEFAWAGVMAYERTGANELRSRDDIRLTLVGLHPESAVQAALGVTGDDSVGSLEWSPFVECDHAASCTETYRLEARWIDPSGEPLALDLEISVSIQFDIDASIPADAQVNIDVASP